MCGMIITYWFRILIAAKYATEDISKMICGFAYEYDIFDDALSDKKLYFSKRKNELLFDEDEYYTGYALPPNPAFGSMIATKGKRYCWTIELHSGTRAALGIIHASKCKEAIDDPYWYKYSYGYAYGTGKFYHNREDKRYGDHFSVMGNIIEIHLDFKENNELSFGNAEYHFGTACKVNDKEEYKLAINVWKGKVTILDFDIRYS